VDSFNEGIRMDSSTIRSTGANANPGDIRITGTGGQGESSNTGMRLQNNNLIETNNGNIFLEGYAGTGTAANNKGIRLESGTIIRSNGSDANAGTISLFGVGGN